MKDCARPEPGGRLRCSKRRCNAAQAQAGRVYCDPRRRSRGDRRAACRRTRPGASASPRLRSDGHADSASRGDHRRKRVLRPLLRDLPLRREHRRPSVSRGTRNARRRRTAPGDQPLAASGAQARHRSADRQPERGAAAAARLEPDRAARRRRRTAHVRPGPQLRARTGSVRRRQDGPVPTEHRDRHRHLRLWHAVPGLDGDGLLRRQHPHGALELRAAIRHERQLCTGPRSAARRSGTSTSSPATPAASASRPASCLSPRRAHRAACSRPTARAATR